MHKENNIFLISLQYIQNSDNGNLRSKVKGLLNDPDSEIRRETISD